MGETAEELFVQYSWLCLYGTLANEQRFKRSRHKKCETGADSSNLLCL